MEAISITARLSPEANTERANSVAGLGSSEFFQLMIAELTNQDPFDPTNNEDLLNQISSIREIELSATLTDSLRLLTGQQRFSSASSMIGKYVTGMPDSQGNSARGVVVAVRFEESGQPMLQLADGSELPIERVAAIEAAESAAEGLIGQQVTGLDRRDPSNPEIVEGQVTAVRTGERGELILELDSGDALRLRDVARVGSVEG